jgi:Mlc titration factor MtfA (ptsG expression regulator)
MRQLANFEKELPLLDRIQTQDGRRLAEHLNIRAYMQERDVIAKQVASINENAQALT